MYLDCWWLLCSGCIFATISNSNDVFEEHDNRVCMLHRIHHSMFVGSARASYASLVTCSWAMAWHTVLLRTENHKYVVQCCTVFYWFIIISKLQYCIVLYCIVLYYCILYCNAKKLPT